MRRRHRIPALFALFVFTAIAACGGEPFPAPEGAVSDGPGITGVLVGEDGEALPWINVMACTPEVCYYTDSDGDGRFRFLLDSAGEFLIKTFEDLEGQPRRSSPMVPVAVTGTEMVELGKLYAPTLPAAVPVGANGVVPAGDGLTLTFDPDTPDMPAVVAARRIPGSMIPEYPVVPGERVIAVYALHPFAWKTEVPIGVRVQDPGAATFLRTIDEIDGGFSEPIEGQSVDGEFVTHADAGITSLTHLVILGED